MDENAEDQTIDLSDVFGDEDGDEIIFSVENNSNPQLLSSSLNGSNLVLDFVDGMFGNGEITIEATANGKKVSDTFNITVNEVDVPPIVANPLGDINVDENAEDQTIDLSDVFGDEDGDEIVFSVENNSNPQLLSSSLNGSNFDFRFC